MWGISWGKDIRQMAAAATQAKDDGVMSRGGGNGNGETQAGSGDIKKLQYKGHESLPREREEGMKDYTMFLTWIARCTLFTKIRNTKEDTELGRKITSSVWDMLDLRYLNKNWICECGQQVSRYICLTFKRSAWPEAQFRHHQHLPGHSNLGVKSEKKKDCQKKRRKPSGKWCHRSQENPSRLSKGSTVSYIAQTE